MTLWSILPAKPFATAKSRLAKDFSPQARRQVAAALFDNTLGHLLAFARDTPVLVVSKAPEILSRSRARGAQTLHEGDSGDLNSACTSAASYALSAGASSLLIISADLPLLALGDLAALAATDSHATIAPDRHNTGTNALFWRGAALPKLHFGTDSFHSHLASMANVGMPPHIVRRPGLACDLDTKEDIDVVLGYDGNLDWLMAAFLTQRSDR